MKYYHNLGHGEIKVNYCSNHTLALDLLRISILAKDTLDFYKLSNSFGFQVSDFTVVFYLMSLEFYGIYTMTEIARIKLPKSINELAAFLSQKNFRSLLYVCQVFWSNCSIASDQKDVTERYRPIIENLYRLIDVSKNRYRECSLYFEA
ncbi:uncharacterized protein RHIMIDRAFT_19900 [Rhizopus microsporus ATCC 52813]|uniref:Uncharacterized protein n=1 Tax=Rhizopus microsporus ATCC 52813 TaxID=1340429 RepID=A0A2G4SSV7_RHIZD|nr:uncharacterized protein RHIMIDRAFT_19900 [Rhizopus microsporus ATCC 52813]PHZ11878.1 hypothetical protein RHIMIDRAFT_19900 [Rhizopus microsporus ATCC 52813]